MSGQTVSVDKNVEAYARMQNYNIVTYNGRALDLAPVAALTARATMAEVLRRHPVSFMQLEGVFRKMHVIFQVALDPDELIRLCDTLKKQEFQVLVGPDYMLCTDCIMKDLPHGDAFNIKKCGQCHRTKYCCKVAQRRDWAMRHKAVCKKIDQ
jgi:hypothetical protein